MPDADIANAVSALMGAAYGSCGERCVAIPLVVAVGDAAADAVIAGLKTEISKMKVGPGTDRAWTWAHWSQGPLRESARLRGPGRKGRRHLGGGRPRPEGARS